MQPKIFREYLAKRLSQSKIIELEQQADIEAKLILHWQV
jgi:hypothetical protein